MERIELLLNPEFNSFIEYVKDEIEKKSEFLYKYPQFYTLNHLQILEEMLNQDFTDEYIKFEIVYPEDKVSMMLFGLFPKVRIDYKTNLFEKGRHFSMSYPIPDEQLILMINPKIRNNVDYVFVKK